MTALIRCRNATIEFGRRKNRLAALRSINLELVDGDRLGIIGPNGAGKSTLLQVLSGRLRPTQGAVEVQVAPVEAIFSVAGVFNMHATAKENIILRSVYAGHSLGDVYRRMPDIIKASGLEIDDRTPLRQFSSGMVLRLAFATVTAFESPVVLLDEWIGVADKNFAAQAQKRLARKLASTPVVVIASHNENIIRNWCNRAIVLRAGAIVFEGSVGDAIAFNDHIGRVSPKAEG